MKTQRKVQKLILGVCALAAIAAAAYAQQNDVTPSPFRRLIRRQAPAVRDAKSLRSFTNSGVKWASSDSVLMPLAGGDLDTAFDVDGKVTTQIGGAEDVALSVALQPDGKIVCAGYSATGTSNIG